MSPIQAAAFVEGWDAMLMGKPRASNPHVFRGIRRPAWEAHRERGWDRGWTACQRGERFIDPRKPRRGRRRKL